MGIRIKNWDSFQHYRDRNPPWIKLHRRLLNDREFFSLDGDCVKTLVLLWMLAAETTGGELPAIEDIAFRLRLDSKVLACQISKLNHWLIVDASDMLAECKQIESKVEQSAPSETETETETEDLTSTLSGGGTCTDRSFSLENTQSSKPIVFTSERSRDVKQKREAKGSATWAAYSESYKMRYGNAPTRNAKTSSLCVKLVDALGIEDAPRVASYYPTSNYGYYVSRGHPLDACLADCQKLLTELNTGNRTTQHAARETDRIQEQGEVWRRIIEKRGTE
jgi:hypothetical protein